MSLAAAGTLIAWIMGGSVVYFVAAKESHDLFDERLQPWAQWSVVSEHEIDEIKAESRHGSRRDRTDAGSRYKYQIVSRSGECCW